MKEETIELIGIMFILLIVIDLVLFVMRKISTLVFWIVIIICAIVAYKVLPWLRNRK
jgi:hypothetical protein